MKRDDGYELILEICRTHGHCEAMIYEAVDDLILNARVIGNEFSPDQIIAYLKDDDAADWDYRYLPLDEPLLAYIGHQKRPDEITFAHAVAIFMVGIITVHSVRRGKGHWDFMFDYWLAAMSQTMWPCRVTDLDHEHLEHRCRVEVLRYVIDRIPPIDYIGP